jgi:uncharacterized membrane protein HdeD (DUF308 family)
VSAVATSELGGAVRIRADLREVTSLWWTFLVTGILWIVISLIVLGFDEDSVSVIAALVGAVLILTGLEELMAAFVLRGWRWLHGLFGVLFIIGGILAFTLPVMTFGTLAVIVAWYLLFRGTFEVVVALMNRDVELWWLALIAGLLQLAVAFWAMGYPERSAVLLIVWVGVGAIVRGVTQIVFALQLRDARRVLAT